MANRTRELAEGLWRIRIDSECGLVVNVYALASGDAFALVDTGFPHTVEQLREGLSEIGRRPEDVTDVLYTHTHVDHIGGGAALAHRWHAAEWIWSGASPAFGDVFAHLEASRSLPEWPLRSVAARWEADPVVQQMRSKPRPPIRTGAPGQLRAPRGVAFGEVVSIGELRFECVDARGHDPYHCAWLERGTGWLFSGDVVLAVPTPLVAGTGDCAGTYLGTLERWARQTSATWLLPGHGMPTRLIVPSVHRSRAAIERLYLEIERQLGARGAADSLEATRAVLPSDPSRYASRTAGLLATVETLLVELERLGVVETDGPGMWRLVARLPGFDELSAP